MRVNLQYMGQVKLAAGLSSETLELPGEVTPMQLVRAIVDHHPGLERLLARADGEPPAVLLFLGDEQLQLTGENTLPDGCEVILLTPIAGG